MKISALVSMMVAATLVAGVADARDTRLKLPIKDAMAANDAQAKLGTEVQFFFGADGPKPAQVIGTWASNKKTNFANRTDKEGCEWAFLSAMLSLRDRALMEGGNAVINIESNYKNLKFVSATEYECGAGAIMGGVALRGTVVKL